MSIQGENQEVVDLIGGVEVREFLLKKLLEGPTSGIKLRESIAEFKKIAPHLITDTLIYYNLGILRKAGYINSVRYWRHKVFQLEPKKISNVRRHFDISPTLAYIGAIESEEITPVSIGRYMRETIGVDPRIFFMVVKEETRGKWKPPGSEYIHITEQVWNGEFNKLTKTLKKIIDKNILNKTFIVDVGGGSRVCSLALFKLAIDYGFSCINTFKLSKPSSWLINKDKNY
ncbi:MAG: hypothetical protein ACTSUV_03185 [Candidatus Ranarchaeia archaeon]